jgi:hypothetical protein
MYAIMTNTTGIKNHGSRIDIKIIAPRMDAIVEANILRESERFDVRYGKAQNILREGRTNELIINIVDI